LRGSPAEPKESRGQPRRIRANDSVYPPQAIRNLHQGGARPAVP